MAESGPITHVGKTLWTNRVEVSFVQCEIGPTVAARDATLLARRATRRTTHYPCIVAARFADRHHRPTMAAEPAADRPSARVKLTTALRAGNQESHGSLQKRIIPYPLGTSYTIPPVAATSVVPVHSRVYCRPSASRLYGSRPHTAVDAKHPTSHPHLPRFVTRHALSPTCQHGSPSFRGRLGLLADRRIDQPRNERCP